MSSPRKAREIGIVMATHDTPAYVRGEDSATKAAHNISTQDFAAQLSALSKEHKGIVRLALAVSKAGGKLNVGGETVTRKEVTALSTAFSRRLKTLNKNYIARSSKKRRAVGAVPRTSEGLSQPSFIKTPLRDFLMAGNFGPDTVALRQQFTPLVREGIFNRTIMTPLMVLYAHANGLRTVTEDGIYYRTDAVMNKHLGAYLTALETQGRDPDYATTKSGKNRQPFDRNSFVYNRFQSITNMGILSKEELSPAQAARVADPGLKAQLSGIRTAVSASKDRNAPSEKKTKASK